MKYLPLIIFSLFLFSCSSSEPKTYNKSNVIRNLTTGQKSIQQKTLRKAQNNLNYDQADLIKIYSKARQVTY